MCQHVGRLLSTEFLGFLFGESDVTGRPDSALVSQYLVALGAAFRCSGIGQCSCGFTAEQVCSGGHTYTVGHGGDGSEAWRCGVSVLEREVGETIAGTHGKLDCGLGADHGAIGSTLRCDICQSWAGHHVRRLGGCARTVVDGGCAVGPTAGQDLSPGRVLDALSDGRMDCGSPSYGLDERCHDAPGLVLSRDADVEGSEERGGTSVGERIVRPAESVHEKMRFGPSDRSADVRENDILFGPRRADNSNGGDAVRITSAVKESLVSEKTLSNRAKRVKARDRKKRKQASQRVSPSLPAEKMSWRKNNGLSGKVLDTSATISAVDAAKESLARVWLLRNKREEAKLLREELVGGDDSGAHAARLSALDKEEQAAAIERRIVENQVKKAKADHELKVLQARNLVISVEKDRVAQLAAVERGRVSVEKAHATLKSSGSSSFAETLLSGSSGSVSPNSSISQQELLNLEKRKLDLERENEENKDVIKDLIALVRSTDDGGEVASRVRVYMKKKEKALSWLTLDEHGSVDQAEIDKRFPSGWDAVIHEDIGKVHIEPAYGVTQLSGGKYERVACANMEEGMSAEDDNLSNASVLTGDNLIKKLRDLELMLAR